MVDGVALALRWCGFYSGKFDLEKEAAISESRIELKLTKRY